MSEDAANIILPVFDPTKIKKDSLILVDGKRRFGKTTWTRWLLSFIWMYFADGGYVFTKTKHNWFWQQHFPDTRVYNKIEWDVIDFVLTEQKKNTNDGLTPAKHHWIGW